MFLIYLTATKRVPVYTFQTQTKLSPSPSPIPSPIPSLTPGSRRQLTQFRPLLPLLWLWLALALLSSVVNCSRNNSLCIWSACHLIWVAFVTPFPDSHSAMRAIWLQTNCPRWKSIKPLSETQSHSISTSTLTPTHTHTHLSQSDGQLFSCFTFKLNCLFALLLWASSLTAICLPTRDVCTETDSACLASYCCFEVDKHFVRWMSID